MRGMLIPREPNGLVPILTFGRDLPNPSQTPPRDEARTEMPILHKPLEAARGGARASPRVVMSELGPYIEIVIRPPGATAGGVDGAALIDTGATHTVVRSDVMARLGLKPVGKVEIVSPGAPSATLDTFSCELHFPLSNIPKLVLPQANASPLDGSPFIALLGRDFLADKLLILDGRAGYYTLAW